LIDELKRRFRISTVTPLKGHCLQEGYKKLAIFDQISQRVRDMCNTVDIHYVSLTGSHCVTDFPMILSDL